MNVYDKAYMKSLLERTEIRREEVRNEIRDLLNLEKRDAWHNWDLEVDRNLEKHYTILIGHLTELINANADKNTD